MLDRLPRRQTRPFTVAIGPEVPAITPPSLDLMEHLEEVFMEKSFAELHGEAVHSPESASMALSVLAETAGKEKVLGYLRGLIERAREVGSEVR